MQAIRQVVSTVMAFILAMGLLSVGATSVMAATQGSCSGTDPEKVLIWENRIGDTMDGDDNLWKCTSDPNLQDDLHTLPGNCNTGLGSIGKTTWEWCTDSITMWIPTHRKLCLYYSKDYRSPIRAYVGPASNWRVNTLDPSIMPESWLWSFRFVPSTSNC
jgi:hypothetical protein